MYAYMQTREQFVDASLSNQGQLRKRMIANGIQPHMSPEFFELQKNRYLDERAELLIAHADAVKWAAEEGAPVPDVVKNEYPHITFRV